MNISEKDYAMIASYLDILNGIAMKMNLSYFFAIQKGKKYIKVVSSNSSVHSFIDSEMNVFKPASYSSPAKGIRYNLNTDLERLNKIVDPWGSYLYR